MALQVFLMFFSALRWLWRSFAKHVRRRFIAEHIKRAQQSYPATSSPVVFQLSGDTVIKLGARGQMEASALRFVAKHTSLPVPEVLDAWPGGPEDGYLITRRLKGVSLADAMSRLSDAQRRVLAAQLAGYVRELRELVPPDPGAICSVDGGPFFEDHLASELIGPFKSVEAYHDWRCSGAIDVTAPGQPDGHLKSLQEHSYRVVFTHGDLIPANILVEIEGPEPEDVRVAGILDWELAGWRVEYWEYVKSLRRPGSFGQREPEWFALAREAVPAYVMELNIDRELQRYGGD